MNYLVTGGAGFIGSHLCERLIAEGHRIVCLDSFVGSTNYLFKQKNIENLIQSNRFGIVEGDVRNKEQMGILFRWENFDAVIHLAAQTGVRPSVQDPILYYKTNVLGTVNMLQLCLAHNVKNFILASSSSVYGNTLQVPFSEDMKVDNQLSPYAATKKSCENIAYVYYRLYGINVTCLRPFTVYGPRQRKEMAISSFTKKIYQRENITLFGDTTNSRDYTYVDDAVNAFTLALYNNKGYEIYNIGGGHPITLSNLVDIIEKRLGMKATVNFDGMQLGEANHTYADITKAKNKLGFVAHVGIEQGIDKYITWYLKENNNAV